MNSIEKLLKSMNKKCLEDLRIIDMLLDTK